MKIILFLRIAVVVQLLLAGYGAFQSDRASRQVRVALPRTLAGPGSELTWTGVPKGTEWRIGVDRDADGVFDRDEQDRGTCDDAP